MNRISHFPDAPPVGSLYKLFYDFDGLPPNVKKATLTGTYTDGSTVTVEIVRGGDDTGFADVTAAAGQTAIIWTDNSGQSNAHSVVFS